MQNEIKDVLLDEDRISNITDRIAKQISADYNGRDLLLVCLLKGSFMFFSDIVRKLSIPCRVDFMQVSSYGSGTASSGKLTVKKDIDEKTENSHILVVDDIVDSGFTFYCIKDYFLNKKQACSVELCAMLDKPDRRRYDVDIKYIGTSVPDEFVVGYGLDYNEKYRNLPFIGILDPKVYETV